MTLPKGWKNEQTSTKKENSSEPKNKVVQRMNKQVQQ